MAKPRRLPHNRGGHDAGPSAKMAIGERGLIPVRSQGVTTGGKALGALNTAEKAERDVGTDGRKDGRKMRSRHGV
jgi:hypothetical protein